MNKGFLRIVVFLFFTKLLSLAVLANDDFEFHKKCLKAKDYLGCINSNKNIISSKNRDIFNQKEDYCEKNENSIDNFCIAGKGNDLLGEPKITGWLYKELPELEANIYLNPSLKQLKVDNEIGRFLETSFIIRSYREYIPDRAPQRVTIGDVKTNCWQSGFGSTYFFGDSGRGSTNYSGSVNCRTEVPNSTFIGGQRGQNEGVDKSFHLAIYDCEMKEFATKSLSVEEDELSEWQEIGGILGGLANMGCKNYLTLPKSNKNDFSDKSLR